MDWEDEKALQTLWDKAIVFGCKYGPDGDTCGFTMPTSSADLTPDEAEAFARTLLRLAKEVRAGRGGR